MADPVPIKFDATKAENMAHSARHYERHPGGELFVSMADMLDAAIREARLVSEKRREFDVTINDLNRQLKDEKADFRTYRESTINYGQAVALLKEIAGGCKGAKLKAGEFLASITPAPAGQPEPSSTNPARQ